MKAIVTLLAFCALLSAQTPPKPLAIVNGEAITEEQVTKMAEKDLENLDARRMQQEAAYKRDRHQIMERALNVILEEKLLAAEAAKRKVATEALVKAEIEDKVPVPTEQEVKAFYEQNKARINGPENEVLHQIGPYLMDQKSGEVREAFIERLKKEHAITSNFQPLRIEFATTGFPSHGPATAPVTIVEFSDFECPYCANLFPTLKLVEQNYADKVRIVFRQFPLTSIHPHAQKAAEASLCANDQKRFWELHDAMFTNQQELAVEALKSRAAQLKLDTNAFNSCLDSSKQADAVKKDVAEGVRAGVTGTPAMFINGRMVSGAQPYGAITKIIEDELARAKAAK